LKAYSIETGNEISFNNMNEDFYQSFINYLSKTKNMTVNSVAGVIKRLKVFLNHSVRVGYTTNDNFRYTFKSSEKPVKTISLTLNEVEKLEKYKTENSSFMNVKDLFLILVYTGMRYSDLLNLKEENIFFETRRIEITTLKTMDHIIIPIHNKLELLLRNMVDGKYKLINNKKFNETIKQVCKDAGITTKVQKIKYYGHERHEESVQKWELIASHTGRRTFITLSLMLGAIPEQVMQISGHSDRRSFQKYVRVARNESVDTIRNIWEKNDDR
jgi:integrase